MRKYSKAHYQANTTMYKSKSKVSMPRIVTRNKIWVAEYLRMNPCACGVSDIDVLQFDHDTALMSAKARRIGSYLAGSLEALQREIEKCTVRCANCHYKRTRQQMGWSWE